MATKEEVGRRGATNAFNQPYRLNGFSPQWQAKAMGATTAPPKHRAQSTFARGIVGGMLAQACGYGDARINEMLATSFEEAVSNCPIIQQHFGA